MKIIKISGNDCGGFRPPKGHLDTQMYPECEGTETDRNIVKKTVEKRKKKKASIELTAKHSYPIVREKSTQPKGIWEQWQEGMIDDKQFVNAIITLSSQNFHGVSKDPTVRNGIKKSLENLKRTMDYAETARSIGAFLTMGKETHEEYFASNNSWYKKAKLDYPELQFDLTPEQRMKNITPTLQEKITKYFKAKFPNASATFDEMYKWFMTDIVQKPPRKYDWEQHKQRDFERNFPPKKAQKLFEPVQFTYHINLNERGSFRADVRNSAGTTVFEIKAGNELEPNETSIFEDGFMKHLHDMTGLKNYLISLGIMNPNQTLKDMNPNER